jgi:hypothetical protein
MFWSQLERGFRDGALQGRLRCRKNSFLSVGCTAGPCLLRFKMESWHVRPAGKIYPNGLPDSCFGVKLRQSLSKFVRLDANHGIISGIVPDGPPEHFGPDHSLPQTLKIALEGTFHNQAKELLGALSSGKEVTLCYFIKVLAHQMNFTPGEGLGFV